MNKLKDNLLSMHQSHWPETYDELLLSFIFSLHDCQTGFQRDSSTLFSRYQLTPGEFDVLATLRRSPPPGKLTPSALQEAMLITSGGLTKMLKQLEARNLITRSTADNDRRSKPVHLTKDGKKLVDIIMAQLVDMDGQHIREKLSEKELRQLIRLLDQVSKR